MLTTDTSDRSNHVFTYTRTFVQLVCRITHLHPFPVTVSYVSRRHSDHDCNAIPHHKIHRIFARNSAIDVKATPQQKSTDSFRLFELVSFRKMDEASGSATFNLAVPALPSLIRDDGQAEDDLQTWVGTFLVVGAEQRRDLWYVDEPLSRTSVAPTSAAGACYNYVRESKSFSLGDPSVCAALANAKFVLTLHRGNSRDKLQDPIISWSQLQLQRMLSSNGRVKMSLPLLKPSEYPSSYPTVLGGGPTPQPATVGLDQTTGTNTGSIQQATKVKPGKTVPATTDVVLPAAPEPAKPIPIYTGSIVAELSMSESLRQWAVGGRIVTLASTRLAPASSQWRPPPQLCPMLPLGTDDTTSVPVPALYPDAVDGLCRGGEKGALIHRYVCSWPVHGGAAHIYLSGGYLRYLRTSEPPVDVQDSNESAPSDRSPSPPLAEDRPATSSTTTRLSGDATAATGGKAVSSKPAAAGAGGKATAGAAAAASEAKAKESAAEEARLRLAHRGYEYVVEWPATSLFLPASEVAALRDALESPAASTDGVELTVRRVACERAQPAAVDPRDAVFGLPLGLRFTGEDYASRARVTIPLRSLLVPGVDSVEVSGLTLQPAVVPDAERVADEDAAWQERKAQAEAAAAAASGAAAAAAGGKPAGKAAAPGKPAAAPAAAPAKGSEVKAAPGKGAATTAGKACNAGNDEPQPAAAAATAQQPVASVYVSTVVQLSAALTVHKPLVARPPTPPAVTLTAADIIPPRLPALSAPPRPDAVEAFRRGITGAAQVIMAQYATAQREAAGTEPSSAAGGAASDPQALERATITALKESGAIEAITGQLQTASERLTREHLSDLPGARDPPGSLNHDLYRCWVMGFVSDQINLAMQRFKLAGDGTAAPMDVRGALLEPDTLAADLRIAWECEAEGRHGRAEKLLKQRVLLAEDAAASGNTGGRFDARVWFDIGSFYLRRGAWAKAHACLREAVASDSKHAPSLLALASLRSCQGAHSEAVVLADSAADSLPPTSADAATALAVQSVILEAAGDAARAGRALRNACQRTKPQAVPAADDESSDDAGLVSDSPGVSCDDETEESSGGKSLSPAQAATAYLDTSQYLLGMHLLPLAAVALSHAADAMGGEQAGLSVAAEAELAVLQARYAHQRAGLGYPSAVGAGVTADAPLPPALAQAPDGHAATQLLHRSTELQPTAEAWCLLADIEWSGLLRTHRQASAASPGLPSIELLELPAALEVQRLLELAVAAQASEAHKGTGGSELLQPPVPVRRMQLHMRLAAVQLRLAVWDQAAPGSDSDTRAAALAEARRSYLRAAEAVSGSHADSGTAAVLRWPALLRGLGRVELEAGRLREAEGLLMDSSKIDPGNPLTLAWLALLCQQTRPPRASEAVMLVERALRGGLCGDEAGTAELLWRLANGLLSCRATAGAGLAVSSTASVHLATDVLKAVVDHSSTATAANAVRAQCATLLKQLI